MKKVLTILSMVLLLMLPLSVSADVSRVNPISERKSIPEGFYVLKPACNTKRALTIRKYSKNLYQPTYTHTYYKNKAQIFYIEPSVGGTYRMTVYKSGYCLSVKNASKKSGAEVRQTRWGQNNSQRWYFLKDGNYVHIQSAISNKCLTVQASSAANDVPVFIYHYHKRMSGQRWKLVKLKTNASKPSTDETISDSSSDKDDDDDDAESSSSKKRTVYTKTINGKKTLTTLLKNAMVPCGRTLYIWGGGWGGTGSDSSIIGYQSSWNSFFKSHAKSSYDYTQYRYDYGKGLDCSGFVAWTVYNTLYTSRGQDYLVTQSTSVASYYEKRGWANLATYSSDTNFRPGDIVSMDGHVWISLGEYSDGSVLLVHSSPKGVQISGTSGTAAKKAAYYMKKYFPEWPYEARTVSSSYLNYEGKARWKTSGSGSVMRDPDGIQKMSASQVMKFLFGS